MIPEIHLDPYDRLCHHQDERGYIVWRYGTGDSVELLQLEALEHRKGYGTQLVKLMLTELANAENPPQSVYGFTRERLIYAQLFYKRIGFNLKLLPGHYREGGAIFFSQSFKNLWERNCER